MTENMRLWDKLGRTDPANTKGFKRSGGFAGTAIKPMWSFKRMTEQFGPCGLGWGMDTPSFQVVNGHNGEILVYCTVAIWYVDGEDGSQRVFGVGGDKVVTYIKANEQYNRPERWENDDEAFKKAYTDAIGNALKLIGVGADVHMGLFDDSKYVSEMKQEFAEEKSLDDPGPVEPQWKETKHPLKEGDRRKLWERMMDDLNAEAPKGSDAMIRYMQHPDTQRDLATLEPWKDRFRKEAKDLIDIVVEAEKATGDNVASIRQTVAPDFSNLDTSQ